MAEACSIAGRGMLERWPRHARATGKKCSSMLEHGRGMLERREECSSMIEDGRGMIEWWPSHARATGGKCSRQARAMAERWPTEKCWGALEQWPRRRARNARGTLERWPRNARAMAEKETAEKFSRHARSMAESQLEGRERNARVMLERRQWVEWRKWVRASEYFTEVNKISQKIFLYPSSAILMFTGVRWPNVRLYL